MDVLLHLHLLVELEGQSYRRDARVGKSLLAPNRHRIALSLFSLVPQL